LFLGDEMSNRSWFLASQGQQHGPFPEAQFREFIASGKVRVDTLVWNESMTDRQRAGDIPGLIASAGRPPALPGAMPVTAGNSSGVLSIDLPLWPFFGRGLLVVIGSLLVIPSPWTSTSYYRWIFPRFDVPGRPNFAFEGKVGDIWYVLVLLGLSGYIGRISPYLQLVAFVAQPILSWILLRWVLGNLSSNGRLLGLEFNGSVWGFLGWQLLVFLSIFTIVGWAWVGTAWMRWICRNIGGSRRELAFNGSGLALLWRTLVTGLACIFLIPIPWMIRWYTQWFVSQLELFERGTRSEV
jgi:hypothetical protein